MDTTDLLTIAKCRASFTEFVNTMLPPVFFTYKGEYLGVDKTQLEWVRGMEKNDRVLIEAFTGSGKTTIVEAYALWKLYFNKNFEILIVSFNLPQATRILDDIKRMIGESKYLKEMSITSSHEERVRDTRTDLALTGNRKIFCKPYGPGVKGVHVNLVLCDEIAEYSPPEVYSRYVSTRVESKDGRIVCISTPVNETDLLHKLKSNPTYLVMSLPVGKNIKFNTNGKLVSGKATCPDRFPKKKIERIHLDKGDYAFQREYMLNCLSTQLGIFDKNDVVACFDEGLKFNLKPIKGCRYYLGADFAVSKQGDYSVYTVIELTPDNKLIIKYMERSRGVALDDQVKRIGYLHDIFNFQTLVLDETNFGQKPLQDLRAQYLPVVGQNFEHKNRISLVINLKNIIDTHKLIIPRHRDSEITMTITDQLFKEMVGFEEVRTEKGTRTFRTRASHDDCFMSLALAISKISTNREVVDTIAF